MLAALSSATPHPIVSFQISFDVKLLLLALQKKRAGVGGLEDFMLSAWVNPVNLTPCYLNSRRRGLWPLGGLSAASLIQPQEPKWDAWSSCCPAPFWLSKGVCKGSFKLCSSCLSLFQKGSQKPRGNASTGYYKPLKRALAKAGYCSKMILYGLKGIKKILCWGGYSDKYLTKPPRISHCTSLCKSQGQRNI